MRQSVRAKVGQLPATVIAFAVLVVVFDCVALVVSSRSMLERPLWTALWAVLGLGILAALVVGRRQWPWWLGLLSSIVYLASPVWGARLHPVDAIVELVFLALLLTPSMRRHVGVLGARRETPAPRGWVLSPGWVSLGLSGVLVTVVEDRHPGAGSVAGRIASAVVIWLVLAGAIRVAILLAEGSAGSLDPATRRRHPSSRAPGPSGRYSHSVLQRAARMSRNAVGGPISMRCRIPRFRRWVTRRLRLVRRGVLGAGAGSGLW